MLAKPLLSHILDDDALTRGLGDLEARILIEWLVDRAERLGDEGLSDRQLDATIQGLCRRARAVGRFVALWCHLKQPAAALQLAGSERFTFPLPHADVEPDDLMMNILAWEARSANN